MRKRAPLVISSPYACAALCSSLLAWTPVRVRLPRSVKDPPSLIVSWCRAWGLFDRGELVGHLYLAGGGLPSELQRVGMGRGFDWVDLGVFSDKPGAQACFRAKHAEGVVFRVGGETNRHRDLGRHRRSVENARLV